MRRASKTDFAITKSSWIATVVVVVMVALVLALLYESFLPGPATTSTTSSSSTSSTTNSPAASTTDNQISIQDATLYSGSPSMQSFTAPCGGDAVLSIELYNPTSVAIHITNITLYGSSFKGNATTLVSLSNSCLTIPDLPLLNVPTLNASSSNDFIGYADVPLQFGGAYNCIMQFDNGQMINQTLLAQAE